MFVSNIPRTLSCGALVWMLFLSSSLTAQEDLIDVISKAEKSVVGIMVKSAKGASIGSGFIVKSEGVVVTNVHVLSEATSAIAVFDDGRRLPIKGTYLIDPSRDICVAKIDGESFQAISIAFSLPRKGEQVVALGCPQGLTFSATRGIVSAIREQDEFRKMVGRPRVEGTWIQVDAAISGGNSGGPLINARGEVVGMSTLGSVGDAQNLNFGISSQDISNAIAKAEGMPLVDLQSGIGRVEMAETQPETKQNVIPKGEIPKRALDDYIARCRREYKDLLKELRKETSDAKKKLDLMKKGDDRIQSHPTASVVITVNRFGDKKYSFRNDAVKKSEVRKQQAYVSDLDQVRTQLKPEPDNDSVLAMTLNGGPWLDTRSVNSIGFMRGAIALAAFNDHDAVIMLDNTPYLLWMDSTAGLSEGEAIAPSPVYVVGTKTLRLPDGLTQAVTILNTVTEAEIRQAIFGDAKAATSEFRTWADTSGKFSIEARLTEIAGSEVVLETRDGKTKRVPIEKLSTQDRRFLGK
jgi:S1-C subfamily serine protease